MRGLTIMASPGITTVIVITVIAIAALHIGAILPRPSTAAAIGADCIGGTMTSVLISGTAASGGPITPAAAGSHTTTARLEPRSGFALSQSSTGVRKTAELSHGLSPAVALVATAGPRGPPHHEPVGRFCAGVWLLAPIEPEELDWPADGVPDESVPADALAEDPGRPAC